MPSSIPNSDAFNWIIGPATQCVLNVSEETRVASLLHNAIISLESQGPMLGLVQQQISRARLPTRAIAELIKQQKILEIEAREVRRDDFAVINKSGLIGLWVSVEVAIEDTVVLILTKHAGAISKCTMAGINVKGLVAFPSEADARRLYRRLEAKFRDGASVFEGYQRLLNQFDIDVSVSQPIQHVLSEINYARNCLLHRNGIVDERAALEAPQLGLSVGEKIKISRNQYLKYLDSISALASALLNGVCKSSYINLSNLRGQS